MYTVEFYETADGKSELWDFLEELRIKATKNKDARIQFKQISLYIQLLQDNGTRLNENITKYLKDEIWELRPGNNRVLYFFYENDTFVLLHNFAKSPKRLQNEKLKKQKPSVLIILPERRTVKNENLERL